MEELSGQKGPVFSFMGARREKVVLKEDDKKLREQVEFAQRMRLRNRVKSEERRFILKMRSQSEQSKKDRSLNIKDLRLKERQRDYSDQEKQELWKEFKRKIKEMKQNQNLMGLSVDAKE